MEDNVFVEEITATGYIPWTNDDDIIELEGEYKTNDFGQQFVATQSWKVMPVTTKGIKKFLQEEITGIGPGKAQAIVDHFGTKLKDILDKEPNRLSDCKGVSAKMVIDISNTWLKAGLARKVGMFLAEHDVSNIWRDRIIEKFGVMSVEKLTANPYILTQIRGVGFSKADAIALKLGFKKNSVERIRACFLDGLDTSLSSGNCFMHEGELKEYVIKKTKAKPEVVDEYLKLLIEEGQVIQDGLKGGEVNIKVIYLPYIHGCEVEVSERVVGLLDAKPRKALPENAIEGTEFSEQQIRAVKNCFINRLSIITGAPGTGKSTTIKGVVSLADRYNRTIALAAPTGRAAKRLSEITERPASTIHRLLKYDGETREFRHNEDEPLESDLVIVDESSMVDIELATHLLRAIGPNTNIVFIGDVDQLPPVGPGSFLTDMIKSEKVTVTRLDMIFRQAQKSLMVQNSHRIKNGEYPVFPPKGSVADSYILKKATSSGEDASWAEEALKIMITKNIPAQIKSLYGIDLNLREDVQVLIPMKKGTFGVIEANKALQKVFNPDGLPFYAGPKVWHMGDKVIQNTNNYELDIFNGDIGIIKDYDVVDKTMTVDFDGKLTTIPYKTANDELALANAITIHKSQGSEYKVVIVVLLWQHFPMLERNLLYTANTRAKLMTLYIAAGGTLDQAVNTNKTKSRNSLLGHRIKSDYAKKFNNTL